MNFTCDEDNTSEVSCVQPSKLLFYGALILAIGFSYGAIVFGNNVSSTYFWFLLPGAAFSILAYLEYRRQEKLKLLENIRQAWGTEAKKDRKFDEISHLFDHADKSDAVIDDRTWYDLNMDVVFPQLDRTITWPGIQRLYQILRSPVLNDLSSLSERSQIVRHFQENRDERESVQMILHSMDSRFGSGLSILLWDTPTITPVHPVQLYTLMSVLALVSPFFLLLDLTFVLAIILIFQLNMYLHFQVQKEIKSFFEGVRSLGQLLRVGKRLAKIQSDVLAKPLKQVEEAIVEVGKFTKMIRHVGLETSDPLTGAFQQYHAIFRLAEVRGFYKALRFIKEHRQALQDLFLAVGEIDAMQSVASYRTSLDYYCEPDFTVDRSLKVDDAFHPLLTEPVPNSIHVQDQGILITGSNMSGKSTFLRTIGLNALFAQTIITCAAKRYQACPVLLLTSIGRADNVVEGKSYYLEEALGVRRILDAVDGEIVVLSIFDEMFRGTNSEERIFAAQRVLEYLVRRNSFVFVATHDLELTSLLADEYTSLHFCERVGATGLEFDFRLKEGPALTRNAIALLRYLEYPKEITD